MPERPAGVPYAMGLRGEGVKKTILLSAKPQPVMPPPSIHAEVSTFTENKGCMGEAVTVRLSFFSDGKFSNGVQFDAKYAFELGRELMRAGKE